MDFLNILSIILGIIASAIVIITGVVAAVRTSYTQPQQKNAPPIYIPDSIKKHGKSKTKRIWVPTIFAFIIIVAITASFVLFRLASKNNLASATRSAQSTATSVNTPQAIYSRVTSSSPVFDDPLSKNDSYKWQEYTDPGGFGCIFTGESYHIYLQPYANLVCIAEFTNFSDFAYQVQMTIIRGESGGIVFRVVDFNTSKFYYFYISPDGTYALALSRDEHSSHDRLLRSGSSSFIKRGLKQSNLIAVVASGSNIYLYVNKQYVTSVSDSTYSSGQIGVYAIDITAPTEVAFSHAQVWNV
jgi:hypothetical protein